ncbi:PREDICTED: tyrosine-protein kinase ABL1-like [Branchiostoma belcheri]|uniref:Tyrosine-protein kinase ABL1-like n=1 Tax=Branchiostoma belcheri TaxID=7741 RepID=A0A6P4ZYG1_BRABE|nr:PREDICTED: tyrosine-protein kinase ABL1-like [Branchiostoma belcheri]
MQTFKSLVNIVTLLAFSNVPCSATPLYATVPENAAIGTNVTGVLTTSQMNEDDVQCEIVEGDRHRRFMITACRITVARPLDYDVSPMYNLTVNVIWSAGEVEERRVDIRVQDVEGYPPVYNDTCETPVLANGKSPGSPVFDGEVTEDERVFVASYELQAVACPPGKTGELCEDDCDCPEEASCERVGGALYVEEGYSGEKEEGLEEAQALLELTSIMEENLAQSLQPGWLNRWEREAKDLTLGQLIGLGTFAHIRKGHLRIDNAEVTVAVKSVRGEDKQYYQAFCREVAALIAVHENQEHNNGVSNIVRLFGVITKSRPKCVLLEYASGDLLQHLKRLKQQTERRRLNRVLLLSNVLRYAVHMSRALEELRRLPIAHGDVAARNVLINVDDVAKLTDFGLARAEELLPLKWIALESLKCRKFTCESDTWSFGVLLWEIAAFGEEPNYQEMVRLTYPNLVEFLRVGKRLPKPPGCPDRLYDVMRSCWREEPSARPTPEELEQKLTECRHEIDLQFGEKETTV